MALPGAHHHHLHRLVLHQVVRTVVPVAHHLDLLVRSEGCSEVHSEVPQGALVARQEVHRAAPVARHQAARALVTEEMVDTFMAVRKF